MVYIWITIGHTINPTNVKFCLQVAEKRLQHRCFPVNIAKFLKVYSKV